MKKKYIITLFDEAHELPISGIRAGECVDLKHYNRRCIKYQDLEKPKKLFSEKALNPDIIWISKVGFEVRIYKRKEE